MSALNPFDKEGKPNATFADRLVIAVLFVLFVIAAIMLPFLIIAWYQKASNKQRAIFWILFLSLIFAGLVYESWLYS